MDYIKKGVFGLIKFISLVLLVIMFSFGLFLIYQQIELLIFGRGDYLLFIVNRVGFLPVAIIIYVIQFEYLKMKEKIKSNKNNDEEERHKILVLRKVGKIALTIIIIAIMYIGMTSYSILYEDSIKVASAKNPWGVMYKYSDISKVKVAVNKELNGTYSISYKVTFNNGDSAELYRGFMYKEKEGTHEEILSKLDKELKAQGVEKEINNQNFKTDEIAKYFGSDAEKLFN